MTHKTTTGANAETWLIEYVESGGSISTVTVNVQANKISTAVQVAADKAVLDTGQRGWYSIECSLCSPAEDRINGVQCQWDVTLVRRQPESLLIFECQASGPAEALGLFTATNTDKVGQVKKIVRR